MPRICSSTKAPQRTGDVVVRVRSDLVNARLREERPAQRVRTAAHTPQFMPVRVGDAVVPCERLIQHGEVRLHEMHRARSLFSNSVKNARVSATIDSCSGPVNSG